MFSFWFHSFFFLLFIVLFLSLRIANDDRRYSSAHNSDDRTTIVRRIREESFQMNSFISMLFSFASIFFFYFFRSFAMNKNKRNSMKRPRETSVISANVFMLKMRSMIAKVKWWSNQLYGFHLEFCTTATHKYT